MVSDGIYRRVRPERGVRPRPGVFLDRDGVIVEEVGYLHRIEDVRFIRGAAEAVARLNRAGWPVVLVTNQAGVGRGMYGWEEFEAVQRSIEEELARAGAHFDGVWACGFHPQGRGALAMDHPFRKPNPGMIEDAALGLAIDPQTSWMVGDKTIDLEAGVRAGVGDVVLVRTGYGAEMEAEVLGKAETEWKGRARVSVADSLDGAVKLIERGIVTSTLPSAS